MGQDTLHAHVTEASAQLERETEAAEKFGVALKEAKVMWDLCLALWGRLRGTADEEGVADDEARLHRGPDSHEVWFKMSRLK